MRFTARMSRVFSSRQLIVWLAVAVAAAAIPTAVRAQWADLVVNRANPNPQYQAEPISGTNFVRLKTASGTYLHLGGAAIDSGSVPEGSVTSHWALEATTTAGAYFLKNRSRNTYLGFVGRTLSAGSRDHPNLATSWSKQAGLLNRSVKFLATADPQYENSPAETTTTVARRMRTDATMAELIKRVSDRRGLIIAGDLTQNARRDEWAAYRASLGSKASTVYDGLGNHDFGGECCLNTVNNSDYCKCPALIAGELAGRVRDTPVNRVGNHYSWDWADVHFVQLNLYPGMSPGFRELDPKNSLDFLKNDLSTQVGTSGRPVVLIHHYSVDAFSVVLKTQEPNPWWTEADLVPYWNAIADYNVVAIITGHLHSTTDHVSGEWFWYRAWSVPTGASARAAGVQRPTQRTLETGVLKPQTIDMVKYYLDLKEDEARDSTAKKFPGAVGSVTWAAGQAALVPARIANEQWVVRDYIPMSPAAFYPFQATRPQLAENMSPAVRNAMAKAMMPTIPVFVAGGGVSGYFVDFEITDSTLIATRYRVPAPNAATLIDRLRSRASVASAGLAPKEIEKLILTLRGAAPKSP